MLEPFEAIIFNQTMYIPRDHSPSVYEYGSYIYSAIKGSKLFILADIVHLSSLFIIEHFGRLLFLAQNLKSIIILGLF